MSTVFLVVLMTAIQDKEITQCELFKFTPIQAYHRVEGYKDLIYGSIHKTGTFIADYDSVNLSSGMKDALNKKYGLGTGKAIFASTNSVCLMFNGISRFEYRSSRLITGKLTNIGFIPESGNEVSDFASYAALVTGRQRVDGIYNLPGKFQTKMITADEFSKVKVKELPKPAESDNPKYQRDESKQWQFQPAEKTQAHMVRDGFILFGRIDKYGNHIWEYNSRNVETAKKNELYREYLFDEDFPEKLTPDRVGTKTRPLSGNIGPCYEYRHGKLIPGVLRGYDFVPQLGGKVIEFSEYQYSPKSSPIYNLPGEFVPK